MAITLARPDNNRTLGVAYCNVSTRQLGACEFVDSEQYCTLESVMLQLGAKEVVMPKVRSVLYSLLHKSLTLTCQKNAKRLD